VRLVRQREADPQASRLDAGEKKAPMGLEESLQESREQCKDLTRLLEAERGARAQAERFSRLKDDFLSTLSHELRTPLSAIMGWSQILASPDVSPEELQEGLEVIERNARTQSRLIDDLQDAGRMISGRIRLDIQRVEPEKVIDAAIAAVRLSAEAKAIRVEHHIDPEVGIISGDPTRLQQVVWNLLSNAIKFTPRGGWVRVTLQRVSSHLEICVQDSGQGISAELLPEVFERFRQADSSTRRRTGGLGIGLSLVRHLVELHGGAVRASSAGENQGTCFTIKLPVMAVYDAPAGEHRHPAAQSAAPKEMEPPQLTGTVVLVVDDEPDARELLRRVFERCQAKVLLAGGAQEAVELLQQQRPHVIVSDIGMPGLDGYDMIKLIRSLPPTAGGQTPAIALTAFARSEDRSRAMLAGFQHHIKKPVETPELIASVASLLGLANTPGEA
jgi:signal transduction histidine kinase/ActR/RegA family two-component response regulator